MSRFGRKGKPPKGFEYLEQTLAALENELRDKVNEGHEGKRKTESLWPVVQINWQRSRYVYDMYYKYKKISKEVYDYCVRMKLVDAALIAKWKKPGYERLCCTYVINTKNYKFGTVSICRVPRQNLAADAIVEDQHSGCLGCASGPGGQKNIFGNRYGQYLAPIQIAREEEAERRAAEAERRKVAAAVSSTFNESAKGGRKRDRGEAAEQDELEEEEASDGEDAAAAAATSAAAAEPAADGPWAANERERNMTDDEPAGGGSGAKRPRFA